MTPGEIALTLVGASSMASDRVSAAKCFASIVGPITLASNDSCRLALSRSASAAAQSVGSVLGVERPR
jgi:hypothetical protein